MSKSKNPNQKKAVKAVVDIKPQTPVDIKAVAALEDQYQIARAKVDFEYADFENNLISKDLIEVVREHTEKIHYLLTTRRKCDLQIASELSLLRNQFLGYATKNGLDKTKADEAFGEYVQVVFNIKASRASEYIRVANKKILKDFKLPISSLVELSRLNDEALEEFLQGWPEQEIATMTFREVQVLVRDNNENKIVRQTTKTNSGRGGGWTKNPASITVSANIHPSTQVAAKADIEEAAEVIMGEVEPIQESIEPNEQDRLIAAANLRVAFAELKTTVDKLGLDKITTNLLSEISQYYESAQKKGGV
jgi:hypothetical protein